MSYCCSTNELFFFHSYSLMDIAQNAQSGQGKFGPRSRKITAFQHGHDSNSQRIIEELFFSNFG